MQITPDITRGRPKSGAKERAAPGCETTHAAIEPIILETAVQNFRHEGEARIVGSMTRDLSVSSSHRSGDQSAVVEGGPPAGVNVDSWAGAIRVEWDQEAAVTPLGSGRSSSTS